MTDTIIPSKDTKNDSEKYMSTDGYMRYLWPVYFYGVAPDSVSGTQMYPCKRDAQKGKQQGRGDP
jgi:hypothetical protein